ncbi:nitroreductase family deazaflavin-dependent oxidoreductase [Nocardioides stalactiti]|uniref:nitroreductase family deazaflavin-dependent oxidoreductase n=1 Tax=Nocardioides stalactiti TaxID=2755356 RepID=UPI00160077A7|nr:nitroreductase family deazaflavin-dependent oxidoreductase [Nocardioides stalactiti]
MSTATPAFAPQRPGLLKPLAVRIGAISWMPKLLPQIVRTDKALQGATRGKVTILDVAGLPNLMLTVTGRKSGIPRSNPLLCVPDGDRILIAGSYFGGPKEPLWVKNIEANPEVTARLRGETFELTARPLLGAERAEAWTTMVATWPNFLKYEERTDREIKVFALIPR